MNPLSPKGSRARLRLTLAMGLLGLAAAVGYWLLSKQSQDRVENQEAVGKSKEVSPQPSEGNSSMQTGSTLRTRHAAGTFAKRVHETRAKTRVTGEELTRAEAVFSPFYEGNFGDRLALLRELEGEMTREDFHVLLGFIRHGGLDFAGPEQLRHYLVNEVLNALRSEGLDPEALLSTLQAVAGDASLPEVSRDYALQTLSLLAKDDPVGVTEAALESWRVAMNETNTSLPGTALLGMQRADRLGWSADPALRDELKKRAATLAADDSADPRTRTSALGVLGLQGDPATAPLLTATIQDAQRSVGERMAAVAALTEVDSATAAAVVPAIANDQALDPRLRHAAAAALQRLHQP